jgi:drug/metabolite transporter (DMT)-like permease
MKMKKVKKIIGWAILAAITVGILSVPIIEMGWRDGLIIMAIILALFGIMCWALNAIVGE